MNQELHNYDYIDHKICIIKSADEHWYNKQKWLKYGKAFIGSGDGLDEI